jgi:hypothetical protein
MSFIVFDQAVWVPSVSVAKIPTQFLLLISLPVENRQAVGFL